MIVEKHVLVLVNPRCVERQINTTATVTVHYEFVYARDIKGKTRGRSRRKGQKETSERNPLEHKEIYVREHNLTYVKMFRVLSSAIDPASVKRVEKYTFEPVTVTGPAVEPTKKVSVSTEPYFLPDYALPKHSYDPYSD